MAHSIGLLKGGSGCATPLLTPSAGFLPLVEIEMERGKLLSYTRSIGVVVCLLIKNWCG